MKKSPFVLVTAVTFISAISSASLQAQTSEWLAAKAENTSPGMLLPDQKGAFDLTIADAAGVQIGEKPPMGGDKKSLTFSGEQTTCFRSTKPFPISTGKTRVELLAKPSDIEQDKEGTLIRVGSQWELRYSQTTRLFALICWHAGEAYTAVRAPAKIDEWQEIEAEFDNDQMALTVDGKTITQVPKAPLRADMAAEPLFLGASNPKLQADGLPRPFVGSMAEIRISID